MKKTSALTLLFLWQWTQAEPFLAEIRSFGSNFCPKGWAKAEGQLLPINQNQGLFSLLGTTFGGDGRTNFALPNLKNKSILHTGNGHTLGETGGSETHTVSVGELPTHSHALNIDNASTFSVRVGLADSNANSTSPSNNTLSKNSSLITTDSSASATLNIPANATVPVTGGSAGGSQAFNIRSPYLVHTYCIALQGVFPSPN
jgi:microcystin-dependent protein